MNVINIPRDISVGEDFGRPPPSWAIGSPSPCCRIRQPTCLSSETGDNNFSAGLLQGIYFSNGRITNGCTSHVVLFNKFAIREPRPNRWVQEEGEPASTFPYASTQQFVIGNISLPVFLRFSRILELKSGFRRRHPPIGTLHQFPSLRSNRCKEVVQ